MPSTACAAARPGVDPAIHAGADTGADAGIIPLLGLPRVAQADPAHVLRLAVIGLQSRHHAVALDLDDIADLLRVGETGLALERIASLRRYVEAAAGGAAPEVL